MAKQPRRKPTLRYLELKRENLRLQRQIAKLQAQLVSAQNALQVRAEIHTDSRPRRVTLEQVLRAHRAAKATLRRKS